MEKNIRSSELLNMNTLIKLKWLIRLYASANVATALVQAVDSPLTLGSNRVTSAADVLVKTHSWK